MESEGNLKDFIEMEAEFLTSRVVGWFGPVEFFAILHLLAIN